jgi:hypothetical protein
MISLHFLEKSKHLIQSFSSQYLEMICVQFFTSSNERASVSKFVCTGGCTTCLMQESDPLLDPQLEVLVL